MSEEAGASPIDTASHVIDAGSGMESTSAEYGAAHHDAADGLLRDAHGFRAAAAGITALLLRTHGAHQLARIEDAVQDAFVAAARSWPVSGTPRAPMAWLTTVAQRRFLDHGRSARRLVLSPDAGHDVPLEAETSRAGEAHADAPLADDELRLLFLCCHPALSSESRVALTLKCAAQFSVDEIARLLRADPRAVAQRLVRAKRTLQEHRATFLLPATDDVAERLQDVLAVCYAMFAEGHLAAGGDELLRPDLCGEALRLVSLLVAWPPTSTPEAHALLALLCLTAARLPARQAAAAGDAAIPLARQDRTTWDRALIARGIRAFDRAATGGRYSRYHAEAEIALHHAVASEWSATDWDAIVRAYDRLLAVAPTDGARLSRWVAMAESGSAARAREEMNALSAAQRTALEPWADWHATVALLDERTGRIADAVAAYHRALERPASDSVHAFWKTEVDRLLALPPSSPTT